MLFKNSRADVDARYRSHVYDGGVVGAGRTAEIDDGPGATRNLLRPDSRLPRSTDGSMAERFMKKAATVQFCLSLLKAIVYCPLDSILKRIERRNGSGDPNGRRPVLLSFQQFVEMYKPRSSPEELIVEKTSTVRIRAALVEAGKKAGNPRQYEVLYKQ